MKQMLNNSYTYVFATVLFTVTSQLLIKWKMSTKYMDLPELISAKIIFFIKVLIDPFILLAIFFILLSGVFWMIAMTKFELSGVYPMVVAGLMLLTSISSTVLFSETINYYKVIGIIVILIGVLILYKGNR